ncbi:DUF1304 domain-containing protein [Microlunatus ginsengisoli]|uniref:DUF1304 domain-containing protein n=1 Tax=Microlunatus ginsengisoli TaxID=363863 RepID=A0ABP7AMZ5_9ACTN
MLVFALVLIGIAIAIHCYIFVLESLTWTTPRTRRIFGVGSAQEAEITKPLAFNQGFYNLFLAVVALIGIVGIVAGHLAVGSALVFAGAGSMTLAGLVLLISSPSKARAALIQLVAPLVGVICLAIALV